MVTKVSATKVAGMGTRYKMKKNKKMDILDIKEMR